MLTILISTALLFAPPNEAPRDEQATCRSDLTDGVYELQILSEAPKVGRRGKPRKLRFKNSEAEHDPRFTVELLPVGDHELEPSIAFGNSGKRLEFVLSSVQDGAVFTFHFSGCTTEANEAEGSFIIVAGLEIAVRGTFKLVKVNSAVEKERQSQ